MEEKKGYDVLRIVMHSDRCYMSTDYIKGKQLIVWLKYHSRIDKEMLFGWIRELLENLENFHQCRGNPCYQYVNPYSIIVGENDKLYLLDLGSREQDELLHLMQRRYVRENFLSPDNQYYQKTSVQEDIYGFGKTVQYLLSAVEAEPALKKAEEFRLKNMISRCIDGNSKKGYQTLREISEHFPINRKKNSDKVLSVRKILVCAIIIIGISAAVLQMTADNTRDEEKEGTMTGDLSDTEEHYSKILEDYREEMRQKEEQWNIARQEIEETYVNREIELIYELALLYFVELEDYHKSREIMEDLKEPDAFARDFAKLCAFMDDQEASAAEQNMGELLERLKAEIPNQEDERYAYCVSKGYEKLNGEMHSGEGEAESSGIQEPEGEEGESLPADVSGDGQEVTEGQQ